MKIGIQTRLWGAEMNRHELPLLLSQVASAGYAGIEIGFQHLEQTSAPDFRRLLRLNGLEVASLHVAGQFDQPEVAKEALDHAEAAVDFAAKTGASFVTVSGREDSEKPLEEITAYARRLNEIGKYCRQSGIRLCHHNHYWEIRNNLRELKALCSFTDPGLVSFCLDLGWAQRAGGDAVAIARQFFDRLGYLHLRDSRADQWVPFGQGELNHKALFELIQQLDFPWQVVEQEPAESAGSGEPLSAARLMREFIRQESGF